MQVVQEPVAAWDVDPATVHEVFLHSLSGYQQSEVLNAMRIYFDGTHGVRLMKVDRPGTKTTWYLKRDNRDRTVPFEFSICNVCHTSLCEHKEGRADWPAK
jgi:hypothetical protein